MSPTGSTRAEMAVLGALIIDPEAIGAVSALVAPTDFASARGRLVYEAALALHARGEPPDYVALSCELAERGALAAVGGDGALTRLINECPCSVHAAHYARLVARAAAGRRDAGAHRYGIPL